jgi:peptide/nickel transport system permease protein
MKHYDKMYINGLKWKGSLMSKQVTNVLLKSATVLFNLLAAIIGILCLSVLPYLFEGISINLTEYFTMLKLTIQKLFSIQELTYQDTNREWPILPHIFKYYSASMKIFLTSFVLSILFAFLIVYMLLFLKQKWYKRIKYIFVLLESLPDILVILCLQLAVIWLFKETGYLLFEIASYGDTDSFGLPVLCLSFSSVFLFVRLLLNQIEEEQRKDYIGFVQSKGFGKLYIFNQHMLRNVFFTLFQYSKTIILFMLSGLFIVEFLFNINGLFNFMKRAPIPEVYAIGMLYLYVPFFFLFRLFDFAVPQILKGEKNND